MEGALFSGQATESQGGELKIMCSVKPPLRTADPVTPPFPSAQSKLCGQAQRQGTQDLWRSALKSGGHGLR